MNERFNTGHLELNKSVFYQLGTGSKMEPAVGSHPYSLEITITIISITIKINPNYFELIYPLSHNNENNQ